MNENTVSYIRHLTSGDRKTLAEKALKVGEEFGELCKVALPYGNAHGTTHRFIDRSKILEEIADTILTASSIAYQFGARCRPLEIGPTLLPQSPVSSFTLHLMGLVGELGTAVENYLDKSETTILHITTAVDCIVNVALNMAFSMDFSVDDVDSMLNHKMIKWADLQSRSEGVKFPLPFEIHVTVQTSDIDRFRRICGDLKVKPIILDLQMKNGGIVQDVMTSSTFVGDNPGSLKETQRIADGLKAAGLTVIREKIETVPWHPAAPSQKHQRPQMPKDCYFECHFNILASSDKLKLLQVIATNFDAHLSRNPFKLLPDGNFIIIMTYRRSDLVYEDFLARAKEIRTLLEQAAFALEKDQLVEFSIYDTRVGHDAEWLKEPAQKQAA